MVKYYTLQGKRYKSATNLGRLTKEEKIEFIRAGDLMPVRPSQPRSLESRVKQQPRKKCTRWAEVGNRNTWAAAMRQTGGNPSQASALYRGEWNIGRATPKF